MNNLITSAERTRLSWIDALKGFAILTVVFIHSHNGYQTEGTLSGYIIKWITSFHMVLFFACSGFFFKLPDTNERIKHQLKKKCKSMMVPYFIWGIAVGFLISNGRALIRKDPEFSLLTKVIYILTGRESYLASWFIWVLMGVYCIQYLIALITKNKSCRSSVWITLNILFLPIGYLLCHFWGAGFYRINLILVSCFFFFFGVTLKHILLALEKKKTAYQLTVCITSLLIGTTLCYINEKVTYSGTLYGNVVLHTISAVLTVLGLFILFSMLYKNNAFRRTKAVLEIMGQNSIIILLTHGTALYGIRVLEMLLGMEIHTFPAVLSFAIISSAEFLLIKLMPKKIKWMFGK